MQDKKGMAAFLVANMKKPEGGESDADKDAASEGYEGKEACAEDMMSAMQENDVKKFMNALESFLDHR